VVEIGGGQRLQCHRIGLSILADADSVSLGRTGKRRLAETIDVYFAFRHERFLVCARN
jgi:hypothetical protein